MTKEAKRAAVALAFARECHAGLLDKAGVPYVEHIERVSRRLRERWPDAKEEEVLAALLHDTIEDTGATRDDIAERFGPRVAEIVAVTRPAGVPYLDWIGDSEPRRVCRRLFGLSHATMACSSAWA